MARGPQKLFYKLAGGMSYVPATSGGCSVLFLAIFLILGSVFLGQNIGDYLKAVWPKAIGIVLAALIFIAFMRFANRHS